MRVNDLTTQVPSQLERMDSLQPSEPSTPPTVEDFPSTPHLFSVCRRCPEPKPSSSCKSIHQVRREDTKALLQKVLLHFLDPFGSSPNSSTEGWKWSHEMTQSYFSPPLLTHHASFFILSLPAKCLSLWGSYFSEAFETMRRHNSS